MDYMAVYKEWMTNAYFDDKTRKELEAISNNPKEIEERFYRSLEFGTGGLRGIIGAGTNRMNVYTVRIATQGLCNYIFKQKDLLGKSGVVIAHDSRRFSPEFCMAAALVLAGNGIKAYVFDSLRPTPELSFAVRKLNCIAGIVITASHNPPEYNGYKCYWSDGGQIPYPRDEEIIEEVNNVTDFSLIRVADEAEAKGKGLITVIGEEIDGEYIKNVVEQSVNPDYAKRADGFKIVYTPLHGTGNLPVRRALLESGFKNVYVVPEQELPDSEFSTVGYPNPEDPKAFTLAIKLAEKVGADIICATDPDADRVGVAVKNKSNEYIILTGNMTGTLLTEYILSHKKKNGSLPKDGAVISTIVSTDMTGVIAKAYSVDYIEVLTGFKYIGEKIKDFEEAGKGSFLFGFEESYGCLAGTYARDKDAIVATMLVCEMAAYYETRGMSLYDGLIEMYEKYGYFKESIESITLKGIDGLAKIKEIMNNLRKNPPSDVNGVKVCESRDYKSGIITFIPSGKTEPTGLPSSDVLYYSLADESWFCVRPSGTEPKIKIYFGVKSKAKDSADRELAELVKAVMGIVSGV